jgi:hypothetical protein
MKYSPEALPVELVAEIVTLLDPRDILSLRLTSRTLESKLSQQLLNRFFAKKHVELARGPLEDMAYVTSKGHLGCLLQHCTITGVAGSNTIEETEFDEHVRLLTEAFINLKQRSPKGRLASLCLGVVVRSQPSEDGSPEPDISSSPKHVWATALRTFNITMAALQESQLPIDEHLDIFGGASGCSLAYDAFLPLTRRFASMSVFSSLKKLTVSLSSPFLDDKEETLDTSISQHSNQSVHGTLLLQGFLGMSEIMPKLEDADIHWYNLRHYASTRTVDPTIHVSGSSHVNFSCLKACTLSGVYLSEHDLLEFVKAVHPVALTMTATRLVSGTYTSLFEYLALPDTPVTHLYLDDILEGGLLVHFDAPGASKFPYLGITMGPSTLTRQKNEVNEVIRYSTTSRRPLGSPQRMRWWKSRTLRFGLS